MKGNVHRQVKVPEAKRRYVTRDFIPSPLPHTLTPQKKAYWNASVLIMNKNVIKVESFVILMMWEQVNYFWYTMSKFQAWCGNAQYENQYTRHTLNSTYMMTHTQYHTRVPNQKAYYLSSLSNLCWTLQKLPVVTCHGDFVRIKAPKGRWASDKRKMGIFRIRIMDWDI